MKRFIQDPAKPLLILLMVMLVSNLFYLHIAEADRDKLKAENTRLEKELKRRAPNGGYYYFWKDVAPLNVREITDRLSMNPTFVLETAGGQLVAYFETRPQ